MDSTSESFSKADTPLFTRFRPLFDSGNDVDFVDDAGDDDAVEDPKARFESSFTWSIIGLFVR